VQYLPSEDENMIAAIYARKTLTCRMGARWCDGQQKHEAPGRF